MPHPHYRPRRMRHDEFSRRLMRENTLTTDDLIYPVFVHEPAGRTAVPSMPGVERLSIEELLKVAEEALELGIPVIDLFPVIDASQKSLDASAAWASSLMGSTTWNGGVLRAVMVSASVAVLDSATADR